MNTAQRKGMKGAIHIHPVWIALVIAIGVGLWLASGMVGEDQTLMSESAEQQATAQTENTSAQTTEDKEVGLVQVRVATSRAESITPDAIISARTVPLRAVNIRAETSGKVLAVPPDKGEFVKKGDIIARLAMRDRQAQQQQAEAILKQRTLQHDAAKRMQAEGYQTEVDLAQARANLEIAQADLKRIKADIGYTIIRAPFDGVLEVLKVDAGDYIGVGEELGRVVQRNPFLVQGTVSEDIVSHLKTGQPGKATLVDGRTLEGKLFFVASQADEQTRSFPVELEVSDPDNKAVLGATARLELPLGTVMAHKIEPAVMTLNEAGDFGIKTIDENNIVQFHKAEIARNRGGMAWLKGLPDTLQIITVGQGFVSAGDPVDVVRDEPEENPQ